MSEQTILALSAPTADGVAGRRFDRAESATALHIVGVGASAGGLEALERLFAAMPLDTGLAFVVIQHLSPDFKSLTDELLARRTSIPIHRVENGMAVEGNAIYLLPPKKDMIIANGKLLLSDKDPSQGLTLPIDHFFRSLAQEAGERAVAIVLSGTGSDGSRGVRDVHDAGGLVIVQSPETAKFDGMPNSVVKTGVADLVLSPEEMPDAMLRYVQHPLCRGASPVSPDETVTGVQAIFRLLRDAYSIDFAHYKPETVGRRVDRRLLLGHVPDVDEYARQLANDPQELNALYKDLLIGVTRFFRDKEAFARLERDIVPELVARTPRDEELRAWVAGCATGEEAYSMAILFQEAVEKAGRNLPIKIFATDVHRDSLEAAGAGSYPEASLADVSPERRDRFFSRRGDRYFVKPDLRRNVVFAPHNVLKDAPFTRMDLVSCRNLLIYFQAPSQRKALSMFHFALKSGGVLWLGPSESPGELSDEFSAIDTHWKIYRKSRDIRLPNELRPPLSLAPAWQRAAGAPAVPIAGSSGETALQSMYCEMLEAFMPPALLVTETRTLVHAFSGASRYVKLKDGRFSLDILEIVDDELRMALIGALPKAFKEQHPVAYKGLRIATPDGVQSINVTVHPLRNRRGGPNCALIKFDESGLVLPFSDGECEVDLTRASKDQVLLLEADLRNAQENLQAMIEEMETSNEELQATNEELIASNEELQSTNEELHSVNEELYTVNAEHQKKIAELTEITADMDNLLSSTEVHTVFLDHELCIRKFTPKIAETFNLVAHDIGRRIDNFTYTLDHPDLLEDVRYVLGSGAPIERQVRDRRARWFLLRVLPYRVGLNVTGVVLTLIDIHRLKETEAARYKQTQQMTGLLQHSPAWVSVCDARGRYLVASDAFRRLVKEDPIGKKPHDLFPKPVADELAATTLRAIHDGDAVETEIVIAHPDGPHTYLGVDFPLRDEDGQIVGVGSTRTDVTQLKRAETEARGAVVQRDQFLAVLSHELRNPLAAILNAAQVILGQDGGPAARQWSQIIERRSRHMARLLDDLLDVARIAQNKFEVRREVVDLASCAHDAVEEVKPLFDEHRVRFTMDLPNSPVTVEGDPARLQQIQVNLLRNAAKHTPAGGSVEFRIARVGGNAEIRVRDSGAGIAPHMLDKIFDLFVQSSTARPTTSGIGVGLSLVREIVARHGGTVTVRSGGPGTGSEFVVRLPICDRPATVECSGPSQPAAPPSAERPKPTGPRPSILIVDDDSDIRSSLQTLLELQGYPVRTASDGPSALAAIAERAPDVALVDIGLPGYDGCELARRIRAQESGRDMRLIAVTGYGQPADRIATAEAGFDAHLTKPLKPQDLYDLMAAN